jgi:hypothetical protein
MQLDELRRGLEDAGQRSGLDLVEARAAVGSRATRRRRRNRSLAGLAVVAAAVAITAPIVLRDSDPKRNVTVAPTPPDRAVDGWAVRSQAAAGLGGRGAFSAISGSGHSPYSLLLAESRPLGISYSDDGLSWKPGRIPASGAGGVTAIATNGETALAIGSEGTGSGTAFVWQSEDDGRNWSVVASGTDLFGPPEAQTYRPDVTGVMDAFGMWIAWGAGSNGYGAVWTSRDGREWQQVLDTRPPDNRPTGVGSVNVTFDEGNPQLVAYSGNVTWTSKDGTNWGPAVIASVPEPFSLGTVAWGDNIAFGENVLKHGQPTPLLRRADGRQTWFVDPTFLAEFPDARVMNVTKSDNLWIASGTSGSPHHPDAWISADGETWQSMPSSLYGSPDGATTIDSSTLSLAASIGNRIVMFGTTPELDRYYTLDGAAVTAELNRSSTTQASSGRESTSSSRRSKRDETAINARVKNGALAGRGRGWLGGIPNRGV